MYFYVSLILFKKKYQISQTMARLVEGFELCCLYIFEIHVGEKIYENTCNII